MTGYEGWKREAELILPNTVGVGFGRSGTTYVSHALSEHPEVCFSSRKETHFFSRHYRTDLSGYARYFEHCCGKGAKIVAEWSPDYILDEQALRRMQHVLLDPVKVLVCYREPLDALKSAIRFRMSRGTVDRGLTVEEALERHPDLIQQRFYDIHLERLFDVFPRKNVWVMPVESLVVNADSFFRNLYDFLGIYYLDVHRTIPRSNVPQLYRSRAFHSALYRLLSLIYTEKKAKQLLKSHPSDKPAWLRILQGLNTRAISIEFTPELEAKLTALFAPHMGNLERILARQG